jgi:hypothetical protein
MELICPNCGKALPAEALFCDEGGHDLRDTLKKGGSKNECRRQTLSRPSNTP